MSYNNSVDTNVANYNINELMTILDLSGNNLKELQQKADYHINYFKKNGNKVMEKFFVDIKDKLSAYMKNPDPEKELEVQTDNWITNEYLRQTDVNQASKYTERKQKIDVYDDEHLPMNRKQLGILNSTLVPVAQDVLNPTLKNIVERLVNIDSQYRQSGMSSTDYTLDLSDHMKDVVSIRLYSFQIPLSWYVIDYTNNNTCFWITEGYNNIKISIEPGNYNSSQFVEALNKSIISAGFYNSLINPPNPWTPATYNTINGKITLNLQNTSYNGTTEVPSFSVSDQTSFTFFDVNGNLVCSENCKNQNNYLNQTLGWLMGFRLPFVPVIIDGTGNTGDAVLNLNGSKYFIITIDDFKQNHLNNGLISITEMSKTLKLPSYYTADMPYTCVYPNKLSSNEQVILNKYNKTYSSYPQVLPSAPRTLTQTQIYTINEIIKNNDNTTNFLAKAPTTTDVFALVPIKGPVVLGNFFTEYGGSLQNFKRIYFGPVDIDRMRITLQDDKGNIINLNGCDWSMTLITENLYQY
jgi:hypothetical protein